MSNLKIAMATLLIVAVGGCSSLKIETGTTAEEMTDKNEIQAKQIRGDWAAKLNRAANDHSRAIMVKNYVDSVTSIIVNYGYKVSDEWHRGNEGRGEEIKDSEMRQVVDAWVTSQKPILRAWEDNIEYGIRLVHNSQEMELQPIEVVELFDSLASGYYDTYSLVFYPNHSADIYEESLVEAESRYREFSEKLGEYFKRY